jgi:hypothetical protein
MSTSFLKYPEPAQIRGLSQAVINRLFIKGLTRFADLEADPPATRQSRNPKKLPEFQQCPVCRHKLLRGYFDAHIARHKRFWDPKSVVVVAPNGSCEPHWEKD